MRAADIVLKGIPDELALDATKKALNARQKGNPSALHPIILNSGETVSLLIQYIETHQQYYVRIPALERA
tara:strand:+ start:4232 stop:4441 length:210 start_codon:yes stop_codon:yes gene_type:complete